MAETILIKKLMELKNENAVCHVQTDDRFHYNGYIIDVDETHLLLDDKIYNEVLIRLTKIIFAEKSRQGDEE